MSIVFILVSKNFCEFRKIVFPLLFADFFLIKDSSVTLSTLNSSLMLKKSTKKKTDRVMAVEEIRSYVWGECIKVEGDVEFV